MKLKLAIVACDLHPNYVQFWSLVHRAWNEIVNINCKLILVADEIPEQMPYKEDIILWKPIPNIHTAFQAQCIRLLFPPLLEENEENEENRKNKKNGENNNDGIIISDMDMIPMSYDFFHKYIRKYDSNHFIAYRRYNPHDFYIPYERDDRQLLMCYNVATMNVWKEIFHINTLSDVSNTLTKWFSERKYSGIHGGVGWFADQLQLYKYIMAWRKKDEYFRILNDAETGYKRLDRHPDDHPIYVYDWLLGGINTYTDFHMNRPYNSFIKRLEYMYSKVNKFYSLIILIIDSDNFPVYQSNRTMLKTYLSKFPQIKYFFVRTHQIDSNSDSNSNSGELVNCDTLYFPVGSESWQKIYLKTILAMDWIDKRYHYNHVLRTNLSSLWNIPLLLNYLESDEIDKYQKYYAGVLGCYEGQIYCGGSGFILSKDLVKTMIGDSEQRTKTNVLWDDVEFGNVLRIKYGILPQTIERKEFINDSFISETDVSEKIFHFRVKNRNRETYDPQNMSVIYNVFEYF